MSKKILKNLNSLSFTKSKTQFSRKFWQIFIHLSFSAWLDLNNNSGSSPHGFNLFANVTPPMNHGSPTLNFCSRRRKSQSRFIDFFDDFLKLSLASSCVFKICWCRSDTYWSTSTSPYFEKNSGGLNISVVGIFSSLPNVSLFGVYLVCDELQSGVHQLMGWNICPMNMVDHQHSS